MDLQLKGKKALVMGASQGIGKEIAKVLAEEGAKVVLSSRTMETLNKTKSEIGAFGVVAGDFSKANEGRRVCEEASKMLEGIDIVVINTGGPKKGNFLEVEAAQWQEDFQSLWMSFVESVKATLPNMQKNNYGRYLLVTSIAAKEPLAGLTTSNGLRAGLAGLSRSLANEVSKDGVTVNLLLPGYTNTDRLKALNLSEEKIKAMVPAGRLGDPRELASLAAFLASPIAGYITGQSIAVDGGVLKGI